MFESISRFIRAGLNPKDIAVITPDEGFCALLKIYDENKMLNFASGTPINESLFYHKLKALYEAAKQENFSFYEGVNYLQKSEHLDLHKRS